MSESYTVGLFTIAGVVLTFLFDLLRSERAARFEERKHFRELAVTLAFHLDKREGEMAQKLADLTNQVRTTPPISALLINSLKMMEIISDSTLTPEEAGRRLAELNKFTEAVIAETRNPKHYQKPDA